MDVIALLGRNVRRLRAEKGLSQEALALDAGMKRSYLSDLERGTRNPSVKALGRLAAALGVRPDELLKGD
jgi:transcriptional regulator with XRE-family HTH domain